MLHIYDGVAVIYFDNPPLNSLGHELRQSISSSLDVAELDPTVHAVVLVGSGAYSRLVPM